MGASRSICSITSLTAPDCLSGGYLYLISSRLIERSRSNLGSVTPRKSNKYGSFVACCAMSDCSGGSVSPKLLIAFPGPLVEPSVDLVGEDVAAPALLNGATGVRQPSLPIT